MNNKRSIPDKEKLHNRKEIFKRSADLTPISTCNKQSYTPKLEAGNAKTGKAGKFFDSIYVWNLPLRVTCPGYSNWCEEHCYNADSRKEVYDIEHWCINWWWALNNTKYLQDVISKQLLMDTGKNIAVRLHSSGDFFSIDYINMWINICKFHTNIKFWGYTRSWAVPNLYNSICELASLGNVQLFASWDNTMPEIPNGWAKSIVVESNAEINRYKYNQCSFICPEQYNLVESCADCGFCMNKSQKDIIFIMH